MNTPDEIAEMRQFLLRVMRTPITHIKVTGNPATDENTDLIQRCKISAEKYSMEKLDAVEAIEIDTLLENQGTQAEGALRFREYLSAREPLYT